MGRLRVNNQRVTRPTVCDPTYIHALRHYVSGTTPVTRPGSSKAGLSATSIHAACSRLAALEWPVRDRVRRASAVLHMLCWHARRRIMPQSTATRSPRKVSRVAHAMYHRNTHALHGMPRVSACARVDACECVRVLARLSTAPHLQCMGALTLTAPAPSRPPPRWWRPMHGRGMRIKADWDAMRMLMRLRPAPPATLSLVGGGWWWAGAAPPF